MSLATAAPRLRLRVRAGTARQEDALLPAEVPVAIGYNGTTQAVMMATPADLTDFALGFSLSEGIATPEDIREIETVETKAGIDLRIWLKEEAGSRLMARRRSMTGPVGCGLCGLDSLAEAKRHLDPVPASPLRLTPQDIAEAMASLTQHQPLHDVTRAVHAAGFWQDGMGLVCVREDVGRHNALDKLIGALVGEQIGAGTVTPGQPVNGAVVLTSRISLDMVQKCAALGAPVILAVSAPTLAAIEAAEDADITLVALARSEGFDLYTHPGRIALEPVPHPLSETADVP
ncbi:MAG: formate dehydrogenase accessory sulfurtransferase FdhD [Pannonibacter sp.]